MSSAGSVGSVASEDTYAEVGTLRLEARGGGAKKKGRVKRRRLPESRFPGRWRDARASATRHRGARSPQDSVHRRFRPRELPTHASAFFTEIFKLRGTILLKTVPQIVLAAIAGLCANVAKIVYCSEGVTSNEECARINLDGCGGRLRGALVPSGVPRGSGMEAVRAG